MLVKNLEGVIPFLIRELSTKLAKPVIKQQVGCFSNAILDVTVPQNWITYTVKKSAFGTVDNFNSK